MFHYTGSPNKLTSRRDVPNEVSTRLQNAGFSTELNGDGVLAIKCGARRACRTPASALNSMAMACSRSSAAPSALRCHAHDRSEEHTSELQSLMRISYAV